MTEDTPAAVPPVSRSSLLVDARAAATFLTRVPLPPLAVWPAGGLAQAMRAFPLVGAALGLVAGSIFMAAHAVLPPWPAALLAILTLVLLTGALHEDGLADMADGLGARGGIARRLEIMRDSHIGAFGALALLFSVGLRAAALAAAPSGWEGLLALVAAAALSRALVPAAMQVMAPARVDGLAAGAGVPDASTAAFAAVLGLLLTVAGLGAGAPVAAGAALAFAGALVWLARRAFGGYTGDVLGAIQQVAEIAVLLAAAGGWR